MQFVVQSGGEPGKTYDLGLNGMLSVGRQSANDIVVSDEQVSRRHAEIKGVTGGAMVTDLGSSNGTFVNGARVSSPQLLKANDTLQVGTTVLRLVDTDNEGETQAAGYDQPAPTTVGNYNSYSGGYDMAAGNQAAAAQPANYDSYQQYQQPAAAAPAADSYNQAGAYSQPPPNSGGYGQAGGYDPNQAANYGAYNQTPASNVGAGGYTPSNTYQAQPQPYQPQQGNPGYGAGGAAPLVTKPKRGLPLPLPAIIAIVVVLALLIIGGILFVVLGGSGGSAGDIAQPPNSTKLNLSVDDFKKLPGNTVPADTSGVSFVAYSTKDSSETVSKFYTDDLTKKGWSVKQATSSGTITATKGDQTISIGLLPFAKQDEIDAFALAIPPLKGQLHPGDTLILAGQGPTSKIKA